MKKLIIAAALGLVVPFMSSAQTTLGPGTITTSLTQSGSPHNFSTQSWNPAVSVGTVYVSGAQICQPCHTPHNAKTLLTYVAPLWNHDLSSATYTMYTNMKGSQMGVTSPDGTSALCLSCHDGSVALGSFGGQTGTDFLAPGGYDNGLAGMGTDLSNDHPISVRYQTSIDSGWGGLRPMSYMYSTYTSPGVYTATTKAMSSKLDAAGKVQCTSCHGAHSNKQGYQLSLNNVGSQLCLMCHSK